MLFLDKEAVLVLAAVFVIHAFIEISISLILMAYLYFNLRG